MAEVLADLEQLNGGAFADLEKKHMVRLPAIVSPHMRAHTLPPIKLSPVRCRKLLFWQNAPHHISLFLSSVPKHKATL